MNPLNTDPTGVLAQVFESAKADFAANLQRLCDHAVKLAKLHGTDPEDIEEIRGEFSLMRELHASCLGSLADEAPVLCGAFDPCACPGEGVTAGCVCATWCSRCRGGDE